MKSRKNENIKETNIPESFPIQEINKNWQKSCMNLQPLHCQGKRQIYNYNLTEKNAAKNC